MVRHFNVVRLIVALCIIRYNNARQWLNIDLGTISRVKRIATQGRYDGDNWVTSYTVGYSMDNIRFIPYKEGRKIRVRLWSVASASTFCLLRLDIKKGAINFVFTTQAISARLAAAYSFVQLRGNSPVYSGPVNCRADVFSKQASLNTSGIDGIFNWTGGFLCRLIRLLVDLLFVPFLQVFPGNFERNFIVVHRFLRPFKARYVRVYPKTWRSHIAMRVELFGCRLGK